jgi:hypothetical protein
MGMSAPERRAPHATTSPAPSSPPTSGREGDHPVRGPQHQLPKASSSQLPSHIPARLLPLKPKPHQVQGPQPEPPVPCPPGRHLAKPWMSGTGQGRAHSTGCGVRVGCWKDGEKYLPLWIFSVFLYFLSSFLLHFFPSCLGGETVLFIFLPEDFFLRIFFCFHFVFYSYYQDSLFCF